MLDSGPQNLILRSRNQIRGKLLCFLENYVFFSEGAVSHIAYYQKLSIARYQVSFMLTTMLSNYV